jgi:hypothetical protein
MAVTADLDSHSGESFEGSSKRGAEQAASFPDLLTYFLIECLILANSTLDHALESVLKAEVGISGLVGKKHPALSEVPVPQIA